MPATAAPVRLADLARLLGRAFEGDGDCLLAGVSPIDDAGPRDLSFVRAATWADRARASRAAALIAPDTVALPGRNVIRSPLPAFDFARAVERLVLTRAPTPGVDATAFVAADAVVDPTASIGPRCVVGGRSRVGPRSVLHAGVTLYPEVEIGADCTLHGGVVLREATSLGDRVTLQPGVAIGGDGFGYVADAEGRPYKVPQVGRVVIEDDVEVGANSTIDRATLGETRIRRGAKIDNLVQIGHNCDVGEDAFVIAQSGLSGSTIVGRGAMLMARVGSAGHLRIGERAFVGARAGLHRDVADGARVFGTPALEERGWHRAMAALPRLPDALRRLRAIERVLGLARGSGTASGSNGDESGGAG